MTLDDSLSDVAQQAVQEVGHYLVDAFGGPIDVEFKRDFHDPVTIHDRRSEARIREILFEAYPDSVMLGEEEGSLIHADSSPAEPANDTIVWMVDPIDGTSNFASGLERWCISIGAAVGERMVAGVIYQPLTQNLYATDANGAYLNGSPIRASDRGMAESIIPSDFPSVQASKREGAWEAYRSVLGAAKSVRRHGSTALDLAGVAVGTFGGTYGAAHPWDVAAGIALIEKAGGTYVGITDSGEVRRTRQWECGTYASSANPQTLEFLVNTMRGVDTRALIANYFN